jgi:putative FmdB family regulatory protein
LSVPTYEYECPKCPRVFEVRQRISEKPLETCDVCGGPVQRLLSASTFILKGGGWYVTDYPSESRKKAMKAESPSSTGAQSSTGSDSSPSSSGTSGDGPSKTGGASKSDGASNGGGASGSSGGSDGGKTEGGKGKSASSSKPSKPSKPSD